MHLARGLDILARAHPTTPVSIEWERPWHPDLPPAEVALPAALAHLRALYAHDTPAIEETT